MPRANPGPRLQLFGPDRRHSAIAEHGLRSYVWRIVWTEKGKKRQHSTGAGLGEREAAERALADFLIARGPVWRGARRPDAVTVSEVLALYAEEHAPHTADPKRISYAVEALVSFWGDTAVGDVTANTCRAYARERHRSANTVRRELGVLRAAIRYAWREGKLTQEVPVTLPDKTPPRDLWLTKFEAALLLRGARAERARGHLAYFILLGLYAGHRKRAILELQWLPNTIGGHVDLVSGTIDFRRRGAAQSNKRRARIPVPQHLRVFLPHLRKRTRLHVLEWQGKPLDNVKRSFATACRRATWLAIARGRGLPKGGAQRRELAQSARKLRAATPHTLRHTAVTWLVAEGVPFADVGAWVGMSASMVERVYGHHSPQQHQRVQAAQRRR